MLHGLKKLWFSTSNTCKELGDKTTAAQRQNSIVLCPSAEHCLLKLHPLVFSGLQDVLFGGIVYLLSHKTGPDNPRPHLLPKKSQEGDFELF